MTAGWFVVFTVALLAALPLMMLHVAIARTWDWYRGGSR